MNKFIFITFFLVSVLFISACGTKIIEDEELTKYGVDTLLKSEVFDYCNYLDEREYMLSCPGCWSYSTSSPEESWEVILKDTSFDYSLIKIDQGYNLNVELKVVQGGRNTHNTQVKLDYILDEAGNIVSRPEYPSFESVCPTQN